MEIEDINKFIEILEKNPTGLPLLINPATGKESYIMLIPAKQMLKLKLGSRRQRHVMRQKIKAAKIHRKYGIETTEPFYERYT